MQAIGMLQAEVEVGQCSVQATILQGGGYLPQHKYNLMSFKYLSVVC